MALSEKGIDAEYVKEQLKKKQNSRMDVRRQQALVMVMGDIGHSPRMQYHVASLSKSSFDVDVLAFRHSEPRAEILKDPAVQIRAIKDVPRACRQLPKLLYYPVKVLWLIVSIFAAMWKARKPDLILIQNPPTIPVVFCAFLANYFWQAAVVIDWHNYSHSIIALGNKKTSTLQRVMVSLTEYAESITARYADANICVTKAMAVDMLKRWQVRVTTLYDRPPSDFDQFGNMEGRHYLFTKLGSFSPVFRSPIPPSSGTETVFTRKAPGEAAELRDDRPALLVSSTSWTEDEDFGLLFDALKLYDQEAQRNAQLPKVLLVVTGKGPLKEFYMNKVREENFRSVSITSLWLDSADYPRLLGCADLGVSLHFSSSGLDLPMKVVDMFGCGLPVCAVTYTCIRELVEPNKNGLLFSTPEQLCLQLQQLLEGFPITKSSLLSDLRTHVRQFRETTWHSNWTSVFEPIVQSSVQERKKQLVDVKTRWMYIGVAVILFGVAIKISIGIFL
ncbi:hypothetical protein RvY_05046 [Ramazzottius varieornatus]|uniref:Glycosyltransferase subfamily 4-like N-terminal domain-containing protein n=1 Tax=Ramazzottius varieornatus TaxID=947166 RepID=A0A1D1UX91_RAMVA|nr:hypothetical protein RvY_05046 [Ramazzottius varieornatus]